MSARRGVILLASPFVLAAILLPLSGWLSENADTPRFTAGLAWGSLALIVVALIVVGVTCLIGMSEADQRKEQSKHATAIENARLRGYADGQEGERRRQRDQRELDDVTRRAARDAQHVRVAVACCPICAYHPCRCGAPC